MTCEIAFLPVGNADSIVIRPAGGSAVVIDLHKIPTLLKWFQNKKETNISRIYITHEHRDHFPSLEDLVTFLENWLKRGTVGTLCLPYEVYKDFVCTEVTRTCVHSASERAGMGKSGLAQQQLCAGEITILAETSGKWKPKTQTNHADVVSQFKCAACDGRADLGEIAI
jgi:hypothetical protein